MTSAAMSISSQKSTANPKKQKTDNAIRHKLQEWELECVRQ
jgi:hypothetical protein